MKWGVVARTSIVLQKRFRPMRKVNVTKSDIDIRSSSSRRLERAIANRNRTKIGVGSSICGMMGVLRNENGSSVPQSFGKTMSSNGEDHCRNTDVVERSSSAGANPTIPWHRIHRSAETTNRSAMGTTMEIVPREVITMQPNLSPTLQRLPIDAPC